MMLITLMIASVAAEPLKTVMRMLWYLKSVRYVSSAEHSELDFIRFPRVRLYTTRILPS
jgi:hypothetical protein